MRAQSCTPTPTPPPTETCTKFVEDCSQGAINYDEQETSPPPPLLEWLPDSFQPPLPETAKLSWRRYVPDPARFPGPKYPTIVLIHGGGFKKGDLFEAGQEQASAYLRDTGYLVFSVNYRLAPCGIIAHQQDAWGGGPRPNSSGRPPQQTDDVKSAILAAKNDSLCNGKIGLLGGSSGASHAFFALFDKVATPNNDYPHWCQNGADDRPLCAVGLSGLYDFIGRNVLPIRDFTQKTKDQIENYTNTCVRAAQFPLSPLGKLASLSSQDFRPLYAFNGNNEFMPAGQLSDLSCALQLKGINSSLYKVLTLDDIDGNHAFALWRVPIVPDDPSRRVADEAIAFFDQYVKNAP